LEVFQVVKFNEKCQLETTEMFYSKAARVQE
jgi:hypothetical protein